MSYADHEFTFGYYDWYSQLGQASREGNIESIKQLLAKGTDVNIPNRIDGLTPLHLASNVEVARVLVQAGADVNRKAKDKRTPLHCSKSAEITELLVQSGADVNAKDSSGSTPLHWTICTFRFDQAKCLVKFGADVNATNNKGTTPLIELMKTLDHAVNENNHVQITKLLLLNGADPLICNKKGQTVYHYLPKDSLTLRCLNFFRICKTGWKIWEMSDEMFMFYLQWLPQEVYEDWMSLILNQN